MEPYNFKIPFPFPREIFHYFLFIFIKVKENSRENVMLGEQFTKTTTAATPAAGTQRILKIMCHLSNQSINQINTLYICG